MPCPTSSLSPHHTGRADFPHPAFPRAFAEGMRRGALIRCLACWLSLGRRRELLSRGKISVVGNMPKRNAPPFTHTRPWQGPFAPRELPRFNATTNPADSRPEPSEKLCLPSRRCALQRTQSGLPGSWLFVRHAPPPNTPESTPGALARCYPDVGRLRHSWQVGHSQETM
jgi:hypothetical protein